MKKPENRGICPECGGRLAFCLQTITEFIPDQEPFEPDVMEQVETLLTIDGGIDVSPNVVYINALVCDKHRHVVAVWIDNQDAPSSRETDLRKNLAAVRQEIRMLKSSHKEARASLVAALSHLTSTPKK